MKTKIIITILIVILAVLLGAIIWLITKTNQGSSGVKDSPYSAVYLSNGEVYFGKLSWFPYPKLKNVFFIQRNETGSNFEFSLQTFQDIFWGPKNEIRLNSKEIIFWTKLKGDSQVARLIDDQLKNPTLESLNQIPDLSGSGAQNQNPN